MSRIAYRARTVRIDGTETSALAKARAEHTEPLTLRQLAALVDRNHAQLGHIETGRRNASPELSMALAEVLGVERDVLFEQVVVSTTNRGRWGNRPGGEAA